MNKKKIINHIHADVPLLIFGESGWGKSATVTEVAEELGLPLVVANVNSWTAEDFGGIVRPSSDGTCYDYLPPRWVIENKDRRFIFFIDEINQASVSVLHALYRIVLDREVAGIKLNMIVIGAGNFAEENPYLTELPAPLLKRFSVYHWKKDMTQAVKYLNKKWGMSLTKIYTNPRQTEMALQMLSVNDHDSARELGGAQLIEELKGKSLSKGEELLKDIELSEAKKRNGVLV